MKVELKNISIREIAKGYKDNEEEGVKGYNDRLDIRPKYQREFIYKDKQRDAVIDTITKDFPLNVMYWAVNKDGTYEMIDGQQRTISFCQYINKVFLFNGKYFDNLSKEEQRQIMNYKVMVYFCSGGTDKEKLEWFRTVNIAGEKLFEQELRNAVYSGPWVTDAKRYFSKKGCPAFDIGNKYLNGSAIRQDYLETAIQWISDDIEEYMAKHQNESSASELWLYFQKVINWVETLFPTHRKEMKGVPWGNLYKEFNEEKLDPKKIEKEVQELMLDEEVTNKKGIYQYVLTGKEKFLNLRTFSDGQKRTAYEQQKGICPECKEHYDYDEMEGDHKIPWVDGGKTNDDNCQMLCIDCNREKSKK